MQTPNTIYIDSVFLLNLVMDLYLLKLTAKVLGRTATYPAILAGSTAGALGYCMVLCIPGASYGAKVLFGMLPVGMLMIKITFRTKRFAELFRIMGYLYFFSFLMGGFMLFLKRKIPFLGKHENMLPLLLLLGFAGYALCAGGIARWEQNRKNCFCTVVIAGDDAKPVKVKALIDTGNGLSDPVSHKPVAVLDEKVWENMKRWMRPEKYKIIPYHSIGKERGLLEGYEIDEMTVIESTGERQFEKVIIAVFKGNVSGKGSYQMILPFQLSI
ncbi:MAG: sigma-E processing peptidase SpoIIGA [Lachnospiraceae bacterium]|nr:sigma-E processing peptidase SpoIIGA [Lachnospiraceae bacterium]